MFLTGGDRRLRWRRHTCDQPLVVWYSDTCPRHVTCHTHNAGESPHVIIRVWQIRVSSSGSQSIYTESKINRTFCFRCRKRHKKVQTHCLSRLRPPIDILKCHGMLPDPSFTQMISKIWVWPGKVESEWPSTDRFYHIEADDKLGAQYLVPVFITMENLSWSHNGATMGWKGGRWKFVS